jgi:hypothetical protein
MRIALRQSRFLAPRRDIFYLWRHLKRLDRHAFDGSRRRTRLYHQCGC